MLWGQKRGYQAKGGWGVIRNVTERGKSKKVIVSTGHWPSDSTRRGRQLDLVTYAKWAELCPGTG